MERLVIEPPLPRAFVISGAAIIDGTGAPRRRADVVIADGRILSADAGGPTDLPSLNAEGLVLTPGFIDTHAHADLQPLTARSPQVHFSRILQGVTTEVSGNCGFSPFPVGGDPSETQRLLGLLFGPDAPVFGDLDTYAAAIEAEGAASNLAPLVGHGTLRASVLGMEDRQATREELDRMAAMLSRALEQGAFGLSTGLCYTPSAFADPSEVVALARVVASAGGIYATHVRNETDGIRPALREAIETARATGVTLHISHLKAAGGTNHHTASDLLAILERAMVEGIDLTADAYPYTAGSTMLHSLLPPWLIDQGIEAMLHRLSDPGVRSEIDRSLVEGVPGWQNLGSAAGWDRVTIASAPRHPEREGRTVAMLRQPDDRFAADTIARILLDEKGSVVAVIEVMVEDDVRAIVAWPHTMIGSDGIPLPGTPHPRLTGTFPRVLSRYRGASLEDTVARMTGIPARRFQLTDRGVVRDGAIADLVLFDPAAVSDRSTYADPWASPTGVHHVMVGGRAAVWESEAVDGSLGRVLRRT